MCHRASRQKITIISQIASEDEADFDNEQRWARGGPQGANQVSLSSYAHNYAANNNKCMDDIITVDLRVWRM